MDNIKKHWLVLGFLIASLIGSIMGSAGSRSENCRTNPLLLLFLFITLMNHLIPATPIVTDIIKVIYTLCLPTLPGRWKYTPVVSLRIFHERFRGLPICLRLCVRSLPRPSCVAATSQLLAAFVPVLYPNPVIRGYCYHETMGTFSPPWVVTAWFAHFFPSLPPPSSFCGLGPLHMCSSSLFSSTRPTCHAYMPRLYVMFILS